MRFDTTDRDLSANAFTSGWRGILQAFVFNPGFSVVTRYRVSRRFAHRWGGVGRLISRLFWLSNVRGFGCYVSPEAKIGPGLVLPHPVGLVIGDGSVIGANVTVYQNVTLGRRSLSEEKYPTIGDGVIIYAGATLVGGINIGRGAVIAANAVVMSDVPAGAVAVGAPAKSISI